MRLYTFTISHFSEKVRWALDYEGVPYTERRLLPGAHLPVIRRLGPKSTVPVLVHFPNAKAARHIIQGSAAILDYMQNTLGCTKLVRKDVKEAAADLEARADHAFGAGTQRIFYSTLLTHPRFVIEMWTQDGPWWGRGFYKVMMPLIAKSVRRTYRINPEAVTRAKDRFRGLMDEIDRIVEKQRFLFGDDEPCRADIAIASLLAPLCQPKEHVLRWPEIDRTLDPELSAFIAEFEDRPTWRYVLRMYREHRRPAVAQGVMLS